MIKTIILAFTVSFVLAGCSHDNSAPIIEDRSFRVNTVSPEETPNTDTLPPEGKFSKSQKDIMLEQMTISDASGGFAFEIFKNGWLVEDIRAGYEGPDVEGVEYSKGIVMGNTVAGDYSITIATVEAFDATAAINKYLTNSKGKLFRARPYTDYQTKVPVWVMDVDMGLLEVEYIVWELAPRRYAVMSYAEQYERGSDERQRYKGGIASIIVSLRPLETTAVPTVENNKEEDTSIFRQAETYDQNIGTDIKFMRSLTLEKKGDWKDILSGKLAVYLQKNALRENAVYVAVYENNAILQEKIRELNGSPIISYKGGKVYHFLDEDLRVWHTGNTLIMVGVDDVPVPDALIEQYLVMYPSDVR